jgi:hypothetical protein
MMKRTHGVALAIACCLLWSVACSFGIDLPKFFDGVVAVVPIDGRDGGGALADAGRRDADADGAASDGGSDAGAVPLPQVPLSCGDVGDATGPGISNLV